MAFKLASAFVEIFSRDSKLNQGFRDTERKTTAFANRLSSRLVGATAGLFAFASIRSFADQSIQAFNRQADAQQRLTAALRATGFAAGFSSEELQKFASDLQGATTTGDEEILELMAILTTFKAVSGDVFKRATEAALDLSATGFGDTRQAALQLGKALEDPVRGLTALRRSGVSFTESQKELIKQLVESNRLFEAQEIILAGVEGQVKGVSRSLRDIPTGELKALNNELGDIQEKLGERLIPLTILWKRELVDVGNTILEVGRTIDHVVDAADDLTAGIRGRFQQNQRMTFREARERVKQVMSLQGLLKIYNDWIDRIRGTPKLYEEEAKSLRRNLKLMQEMEDAEISITERDTEPLRPRASFVGLQQLGREMQLQRLEEEQKKEAKMTNDLLARNNQSNERMERLLEAVAINTSTRAPQVANA